MSERRGPPLGSAALICRTEVIMIVPSFQITVNSSEPITLYTASAGVKFLSCGPNRSDGGCLDVNVCRAVKWNYCEYAPRGAERSGEEQMKSKREKEERERERERARTSFAFMSSLTAPDLPLVWSLKTEG